MREERCFVLDVRLVVYVCVYLCESICVRA